MGLAGRELMQGDHNGGRLKGTKEGVRGALGAGGSQRRTEGFWKGHQEPGVLEASHGFWRRGEPPAPPPPPPDAPGEIY